MSSQESLRINIFGVGRSGTKAVQLWLAYMLANKYGEVLVNYEPFHHLSKSGGQSEWGKRIHLSLPFLTRQTEYSGNSFPSFCRTLTRHPIVITKFIRATGRINLINAYTKPDLSFLVVRDLYEVLNSVGKLTWNLFDDEKKLAPLASGRTRNLPYGFISSQIGKPI